MRGCSDKRGSASPVWPCRNARSGDRRSHIPWQSDLRAPETNRRSLDGAALLLRKVVPGMGELVFDLDRRGGVDSDAFVEECVLGRRAEVEQPVV